MWKGKFAFAGIVSLTLIWAILPLSKAQCDTVDDDASLEFYWTAATGNVDHYNVYLSTNEGDYLPVGTTVAVPTQENPYVVSISAEDGEKYRLKVEAEDEDNNTGPMSDQSDLVWCKLRSPGDVTKSTPGDADASLGVDAGDWVILFSSWGKQRGTELFNYRADLNYDDIVNVLDVNIVGVNWGNVYGSGAPTWFPPLASNSRCKIRVLGQKNIVVGQEILFDIVMEGAEDMCAMDFEVSFDPALVKVEAIEQGTFFSAKVNPQSYLAGLRQYENMGTTSWIAGKISQTHGRISSTLAAVIPGSTNGTSGDGVVARLRLTPKSDGISSISLDNIHAYDSKLNGVLVEPINIALTIGVPEYRLEQNYPNPFNPETWIPYALAMDCDKVTVVIHDILGAEVRRLELGHRNAGFYTTQDRAAYWDGKNENGISVASGLYFYQIKAGTFSSVRKMAVLR